MEIEIRSLRNEDWALVASIYLQGIETGNATFESDLPSWDHWDRSHSKSCRIVACLNGEIAGWAALSPVSIRQVYSGVAEVSVFVSDQYKGLKIGTMLLDNLVSMSENEGFWTLQASIFPENRPSISLHEKLGFRIVGIRERIGKMNSIWRDTVLMERRSNNSGN